MRSPVRSRLGRRRSSQPAGKLRPRPVGILTAKSSLGSGSYISVFRESADGLRLSIVRRDAGGRRVLLDQAPEVALGIFWNGGKSSVRRIRWYAAGNV